MSTELEQAIEKVKDATGYDPVGDGERAVLEFPTAGGGSLRYGDQVYIIEDDEESGLFEGDTGYIVIMHVGAAKYGNERVSLSVIAEGTDCPMECRPDQVEVI